MTGNWRTGEHWHCCCYVTARGNQSHTAMKSNVITVFLGSLFLVFTHCQRYRRTDAAVVNREFVTASIEINDNVTV